MKPFFFLTLLIAMVGVSCVKPGEPKVYVPEFWNWTGEEPMSAYIDGNYWKASPGDVRFLDQGTKLIIGSDDSYNQITLSLGNLSPGEYAVGQGNGNNNASFQAIEGILYNSNIVKEGKVNIMSNDGTRIKGHFSFDAKSTLTGQTLQFRKGYFDFTHFGWSGTAPMSASINGSPFQASSASYTPGTPSAISGTDGSNTVSISSGTDFSIGEHDLYGGSGVTVGNYNDGTNNYNSGITNVGRMRIVENDATHIKGYFYFHGRNPGDGSRSKVMNGYFDVTK